MTTPREHRDDHYGEQPPPDWRSDSDIAWDELTDDERACLRGRKYR